MSFTLKGGDISKIEKAHDGLQNDALFGSKLSLKPIVKRSHAFEDQTRTKTLGGSSFELREENLLFFN